MSVKKTQHDFGHPRDFVSYMVGNRTEAGGARKRQIDALNKIGVEKRHARLLTESLADKILLKTFGNYLYMFRRKYGGDPATGGQLRKLDMLDVDYDARSLSFEKAAKLLSDEEKKESSLRTKEVADALMAEFEDCDKAGQIEMKFDKPDKNDMV